MSTTDDSTDDTTDGSTPLQWLDENERDEVLADEIGSEGEHPTATDEPADIGLTAPQLKDERFIGLKLRREHKKRKKKARQGYVRWYLIDETFPRAKYIKPQRKGGGYAEYEHDGETYLFPRDAMLSSEREGMWTVMHRRGEADPINLRDSASDPIPADSLQEYLTMRVSSSSPGLFDGLDLDPKQIMMLAIGGIIAFAFIQDMGIL
jgi:hypothetical protein